MADMTDSSFARKPTFSVKSNRSCSATACSIFQIFIYGLLVAITVFYLAFFANTDLQLKRKGNPENSEKYCSLYASSHETLGPNGPCSFFEAGTGISLGLLLILLIVSIFGALCGKWSSFLKGFEILLLCLLIFMSISTSLVLSIGYHVSCSKFKGCDKYEVYDVKVHNSVSIVEPTAWITTAAIVIMCLVQTLSCVCICCRKARESDDHMYDEKALLNSKKSAEIFS